jgi:hypothetical protein
MKEQKWRVKWLLEGQKGYFCHGSKKLSCTLVSNLCCITLAPPSEMIEVGKTAKSAVIFVVKRVGKRKKRVSRGTRAA